MGAEDYLDLRRRASPCWGVLDLRPHWEKRRWMIAPAEVYDAYIELLALWKQHDIDTFGRSMWPEFDPPWRIRGIRLLRGADRFVIAGAA